MLRVLAALTLPVSAWACSCISGGPPCEAFGQASSIFVGTVIEAVDANTWNQKGPPRPLSGSRTFVFEVSEAFHGMEGRGKRVEIRTGMGGGDCGYAFQLGDSYVVCAYAMKDSPLTANICSRTARVETAQDDLEYLRSRKNGVSPPFVYGTVENLQDVSGRAVPIGMAGVSVTLTGLGTGRKTETGEDGAYRFDGLKPGKYKVVLAKEGYSPSSGAKDIDLVAGGCSYGRHFLVVDRRITGRIVDSEGVPAAGIQIDLVPVKPTKQSGLPFPIANAESARDGTYEIPNVPSGEYYLGANLANTPSKEMPYSPYFYPGTEDSTRAVTVIVKEGPGVNTFDLRLPAAQKERKVEGVVYGPDGVPATKVQILLEDLHFPWRTGSILAETATDGRFIIPLFDGTAYRIHAIRHDRATGSPISAEPHPIKPGADLSKPLKLVLTQPGNSSADLIGKGLENWRAGSSLF